MAKDEFVNSKIIEYGKFIKEAVISGDHNEFIRLLRIFSKEIERETRHEAASLAQKLSNDIHNL